MVCVWAQTDLLSQLLPLLSLPSHRHNQPVSRSGLLFLRCLRCAQLFQLIRESFCILGDAMTGKAATTEEPARTSRCDKSSAVLQDGNQVWDEFVARRGRQAASLQDFELGRTIGKGRYARELPVCLKVLKKTEVVKLEQAEHVINEKNVLTSITSPFVIRDPEIQLDLTALCSYPRLFAHHFRKFVVLQLFFPAIGLNYPDIAIQLQSRQALVTNHVHECSGDPSLLRGVVAVWTRTAFPWLWGLAPVDLAMVVACLGILKLLLLYRQYMPQSPRNLMTTMSLTTKDDPERNEDVVVVLSCYNETKEELQHSISTLDSTESGPSARLMVFVDGLQRFDQEEIMEWIHKVRQGVDVENPESPKFLVTDSAATPEDFEILASLTSILPPGKARALLE
eukprot:s17_g1.t1